MKPGGAEQEPRVLMRARAQIATMLDSKTIRLPAVRELANEIMAVAALPDSDAAALAKVVRKDAALTGKLLRVANSPSQATQVPIVSLQDAISRLGLRMVRELVLMIALRESVYRVPGFDSMVDGMWRHALSTACYAREIARTRESETGMEFVCGLLHDSGTPLLLGALVQHSPTLPLELGREQLHVLLEEFHCQAGALLARQWDMPAPVVECAAHHLSLDPTVTHFEMVTLVALADQLSEMVAYESPALSAEDLLENDLIKSLNLHADSLKALLERQDFIARVVADLG